MRQYSEIELDALREFTNVGTAHAATALSKLIDRSIRVTVPKTNLVPVTRIPELLGGPEIPIIGLYFRISGDLGGSILLLFHEKTAEQLVDILTAGLGEENAAEMEELKKSALKELGNILINSYLNAMAEMLELRLLLSVPYFAADCLGAVIDFLLIELVQAAEYALLMDTLIELPDAKLQGNFIMFPDTPSLERIFKKVGIE